MKQVSVALALAVSLATLWQLWPGPPTPSPIEEESVETFLANHWDHPLPPQGAPNADRSALEVSLDAGACAQCHVEQWDAWRTTLHSQAMGAGIQWQLRLMDQEQGNRCLRCHAPLSEQKALVAIERGWSAAPQQPQPDYVPGDLHRQGVACAVCHVRGHERFGPPARSETAPGASAHGGFSTHTAFEDSQFCATCHQFPEDGPRLAGKLHEDTYAQWETSGFAGRQSCQQCHMPDRKHLFRGIHDPAMVRSAVDVALDALEADDGAVARMAVTNVGAGHHFPTYMVPKVYLRISLHGPDGEHRLLGEEVIGWQADVGITREAFDTRIPTGGRLEFDVPFAPPQTPGWYLQGVVDVAPREHYERVFETSLQQAGRLDARTVELLKQALEEARAARFEALRLQRPLVPSAERAP